MDASVGEKVTVPTDMCFGSSRDDVVLTGILR
jgi:hypothetical protein